MQRRAYTLWERLVLASCLLFLVTNRALHPIHAVVSAWIFVYARVSIFLVISMVEKINKILYDWDPINLKESCVPIDEYLPEAQMIKELILKSIDLNSLSDEIFNIFYEQFGKDLINFNYNDCKIIADKILTVIK